MNRVVTVVCCREHGPPEAAVGVESWPLPAVGPRDALVEMLAAPIHPADLNVLEGRYPVGAALPAVVGNEGVGVVAEVGAEVDGLAAGQRVIAPACPGAWCEARVVPASRLVTVPHSLPVEQAAMLAVNPPTAWRLLADFVSLEAGDWVLQNAANSAAGRCVIAIARTRGLRTINVVRRPELVDELRSLGADVVLLDEAALPARVREATGGSLPRLGLNAIGGSSARNLAASLADGGVLVTYGGMAREPASIPAARFIFHDLQCRGFWLRRWYATASRDDVAGLFDRLVPLAADGSLCVPVEKCYPLAQARDAVAHAARSARCGKILFRMR